MAEELSYLFITPYTIKKSRTGGILSRLLSRTNLDLVGAQIITPSKELAEAYANSLEKSVAPRSSKFAEYLSDYVRNNFSPSEDGTGHRTMMLLFKGKNACRKLHAIAGSFDPKPLDSENITGETIRDTYSDLVMSKSKPGRVRYFEPAVLTPPSIESALEKLSMFADFAETQPNIVENYVYKGKPERTLVIIKPDNWRHPSVRPGNIIDMLSRTGLRIVGCKVYQMSVAEALEFYGPVQNVLRKKLSPKIAEKAKDLLEEQLEVSLNEDCLEKLTESVGVNFADNQFGQIVEFMSGMRPDECPESEKNNPGKVKCMVLIYEGIDAVKKIRTVLGSTDPTKAKGGTVRRDFGSDIMVNTAHASDSPENAIREMGIVKIENNKLSSIIREFVANYKPE
jgi:nucleoside diphosphate kinase